MLHGLWVCGNKCKGEVDCRNRLSWSDQFVLLSPSLFLFSLFLSLSLPLSFFVSVSHLDLIVLWLCGVIRESSRLFFSWLEVVRAVWWLLFVLFSSFYWLWIGIWPAFHGCVEGWQGSCVQYCLPLPPIPHGSHQARTNFHIIFLRIAHFSSLSLEVVFFPCPLVPYFTSVCLTPLEPKHVNPRVEKIDTTNVGCWHRHVVLDDSCRR